ncbi:hypothetical protein JX266_013691 [Neoarthrinium moseri]|nr:hypothetical protein JX266_013691 [Neoarthrinium moseri]
MSLLYAGLHVRGALKNYTRSESGSPHIYGNYLHASALLVARLSIAAWVAALVATAVLVATEAVPTDGLDGKIPILNMLVCIGALYGALAQLQDVPINR